MRRGRPAGAERAAPGSLDGSLARFVDLVCPHLPPGLVGPDRESHIRAVVRTVPTELVAQFGFECRIDIDDPDADVLFSADAETGGLQMLAGRHPLIKLPRRLSGSEAWAPAIRFCGERQPGCLLHRATADLWAELALEPGYEPVPNFSFGMRLSGLPEANGRPLEVLIRALELGLESLSGEWDGEATTTATALRALLERLPDRARVARAGTVDDQPGAVRLWLSRMTRREIVDLVEFAREHREARAIAHVLDDVIAAEAHVGPRFDVGPAVGPRTRLTCTVDGVGSPPTVAERWQPVLDGLVEHDLCTRDKRDALVHAYGLVRESQSERWPEHLTRLSKLFGDDAESIVSWRLARVDVECERGEAVAATATILASHGWVRQ